MKNILFITGSDKLSGPNKQLLNLIKALSRENKEYKVIIYICKIIKNKKKSLIPEISKIKNIKYYFTNKKTNNNFSFKLISNLFDIFKLNKKYNFDFIQTSGIIPDSYMFILKKLFFLKSKWISVIRSQIEIEYKIRYKNLILYKILAIFHKFIINLSDKKICVSNSVAKHIMNKNKNFYLLLNSLSLEDEKMILNFFEKNNQKHKNNNLRMSTKNFMYVGHFDELKNPLLLIDYWAKYKPENSNLYLYGSKVKSNYFDDLEKKTNKTSNAFINGFKKNIIKEFLNKNYYISASRTEGFPNTVIEALCTGCICILSSIPPHNEIKKLFPNYVFLYKQNSLESLNDVVQKIIINKSSVPKRKISREAIRFFSSKKLNNKYIRILE